MIRSHWFAVVVLVSAFGAGCVGVERAELAEKAANVRPAARQLAWQELEFTCLREPRCYGACCFIAGAPQQ